MLTYSYTVLWFLYTLIAVCKNLQINITILVSELNIWAKLWEFSNSDVRKRDHSYINDEKLGQSYTFSQKKGAYCIPDTWQRYKRGLFGKHTHTMSYIVSYLSHEVGCMMATSHHWSTESNCWFVMHMIKPGSEVIKLFSCSTQLSMKFQLLIKLKCWKIKTFLAF